MGNVISGDTHGDSVSRLLHDEHFLLTIIDGYE